MSSVGSLTGPGLEPGKTPENGGVAAAVDTRWEMLAGLRFFLAWIVAATHLTAFLKSPSTRSIGSQLSERKLRYSGSWSFRDTPSPRRWSGILAVSIAPVPSGLSAVLLRDCFCSGRADVCGGHSGWALFLSSVGPVDLCRKLPATAVLRRQADLIRRTGMVIER